MKLRNAATANGVNDEGRGLMQCEDFSVLGVVGEGAGIIGWGMQGYRGGSRVRALWWMHFGKSQCNFL